MIPGSASPLLLESGAAGGENPYQIERSLRFRSIGSAYLDRTPSVAGNRRTWTWSGWGKRGELARHTLFHAATDPTDQFAIEFAADSTIAITDFRSGGAIVSYKATTAMYRDPSAWYHVMVATNTTLATAEDRFKVYVNGIRITSFSTNTLNTAQNADLTVNSTGFHRIGLSQYETFYLDGYLSEVNFVDGQALTPSSFGMTDPVTGQWSPIAYAGTYGTNGFYLDFSDPSSTANLCLDRSGNANNWTPTGISITAGATYDSMLDVPTRYSDGGNGRGNYATLNPLSTTASTLTNGNLTASGTTDLPTIIPTLGNWYFEISGVTKNWTPPAAFPSAAGDYNFGQRPFTNAITPGYQLLHTGNLTSDTVTTSGSFTGNALADGPFVWMNGAPETLTINGNAVTFGTHADKLANGFKLRTTSASYNSTGTNTWTATVLTPASKSAFRKQLAKANP